MVTILLYILFALSVFLPIYTYAIYPFWLRLLPQRIFNYDKTYTPTVRIIAFSEEYYDEYFSHKVESLRKIDYPRDKIRFVVGIHNIAHKEKLICYDDIEIVHIKSKNDLINKELLNNTEDVIVFTDLKSELDVHSIKMLVRHFRDERIGCVSGQLRKKHGSDGLFWKYENYVKIYESRIGQLSGANSALYAIKPNIIRRIPNDIINESFYIATKILQNGFNVIFDTEAVAYTITEEKDKNNFNKHVRDGAGYYQALILFRHMLLPVRGSFVYVSHRVLKWFVPFNMIAAFILNILLFDSSLLLKITMFLQIAVYLFVLAYHNVSKNEKVLINKNIDMLFSLLCYFIYLNFAYLKGLILLLNGRSIHNEV